jgi:glutamine cyclotransferase
MNPFLRKVLFCVVAGAALVFADTPRVVPAIVDSIPHEQTHFTQGLFFDGKDLIESTGQYGESGIYRRTLDGKILDSLRLAERYFGEGSVAVGDDIFYLTWKSHKAFIVNRKPFSMKGVFRIPTEGWGLTYWRDALLMSNGSHELLQIGLGGFAVVGVIPVTDGGRPVPNLNELELVRDTLYANIWTTGLIAVVELPSGHVLKYLDFTDKVREIRRRFSEADVLNGIAFDGRDFWITGKNWPWIYKVKF